MKLAFAIRKIIAELTGGFLANVVERPRAGVVFETESCISDTYCILIGFTSYPVPVRRRIGVVPHRSCGD